MIVTTAMIVETVVIETTVKVANLFAVAEWLLLKVNT
jgi:hypothetical protein